MSRAINQVAAERAAHFLVAGRRATAAVLASLLCLTACSYNRSPIHCGLSSDEVAARVSAEFRSGMTPDEVRDELTDLRLANRETSVFPRHYYGKGENGIVADVRPPGLIRTGPFAALKWTQLVFWFDDDRLACAAYKPSIEILPWNRRFITLQPGNPR